MTNKKMKVMTLILILFMPMGFHSLFAGEVTFFGPKQYTRGKGKPVTIEENFTFPLNCADPNFSISLINGCPQGENRVSSAAINRITAGYRRRAARASGPGEGNRFGQQPARCQGE